MTERVLVTGATGALGPCVVERLLMAGLAVRALVRTLPPTGLLPSTVELCIGDITQPQTLAAAVVGCDKIVHLAALLHIVNPSPSQQTDYERINVEGTRHLLQAAVQQDVRQLVFISTIAVYGSQPGITLKEETPSIPDTFYAKSKWAAEKLVLAAQNRKGMPLGVVLRLGAVYGSRVKGNYQRLLQSLAKGHFIPVGTGENRRSLIYEKDVAEAIYLALQSPQAAGQLYNVSDGQVHTVRAIIEAICGALDRPPPRFALPLAPVRWLAGLIEDFARFAGFRPLIARSTLDKYSEDVNIDSQKIQRELAFVPRYNLQRGWQAVINDQDYNKCLKTNL